MAVNIMIDYIQRPLPCTESSVTRFTEELKIDILKKSFSSDFYSSDRPRRNIVQVTRAQL